MEKWEAIDKENFTFRLKVFGGWLVRYNSSVVHNLIDSGQGMAEGWDWRSTMVFVPDPKHNWVIRQEE